MAAEGLPSHGPHNTTILHSQSPYNTGGGWADPAWALSMAITGPTQAPGTPHLDHTTHCRAAGKDILLLYAGPKDGGALDDIPTQQQQDLGRRLIAAKSARSMMAVGVMPTPTSNRTPWRRLLLLLSWTAFRSSTG